MNTVLLKKKSVKIQYTSNWRASVASETLTRVTQLKIGDVCLLFIYMFGRMYVILGRGRMRSEHKNTVGQCSLRVRPSPKFH